MRSVETMRRMSLSYDALAADVYWIRALQHFGSGAARRRAVRNTRCSIRCWIWRRRWTRASTSRTGLARCSWRSRRRADRAVPIRRSRCCRRASRRCPTKWQYYQDAGFVYYFGYKDYEKAAEWFRRGSEIKGAPWFLKSLAANTLAKGHDRQASRLLYQVIAETADNDFMKKDAIRRLRQLDTMDDIDVLREVVRRYRERVPGSARAALTWQTLIAARFLRVVPHGSRWIRVHARSRDGRCPPGRQIAAVSAADRRRRRPGSSPSPANAPPSVPWPSPIGLPPLLEPRTSPPSSFVS